MDATEKPLHETVKTLLSYWRGFSKFITNFIAILYFCAIPGVMETQLVWVAVLRRSRETIYRELNSPTASPTITLCHPAPPD